MVRPLLVGVQLPEVEWEVPFGELLAMARTAEAVGFDSVWVGDHLLYDLPVGPRGPWEAWTSLAAIAAVTGRVLIGPLVASVGFHEPAILAKQAATVDAISGGRLIVGLGAGWNEREYRAFGLDFDHRVSRFEEGFTIIRALLRDGSVDFSGRFHSAERCVLHPRPVRPGGPPLLLGSTGERMLSIALPFVDGWNAWWTQFGNSPDGFRVLKERVDAKLRLIGRPASEVQATCAIHVRLPDGKGRRMGHADGAGTAAFSGSVREVADHLRDYASVGASHVQIVIDPITRASIEWFHAVLNDLDT